MFPVIRVRRRARSCRSGEACLHPGAVRIRCAVAGAGSDGRDPTRLGTTIDEQQNRRWAWRFTERGKKVCLHRRHLCHHAFLSLQVGGPCKTEGAKASNKTDSTVAHGGQTKQLPLRGEDQALSFLDSQVQWRLPLPNSRVWWSFLVGEEEMLW